MPLRPIDALFIHPKQRLYVVYYRGELWQLPRMKIDDKSWQNRRLYTNDSSALYLSSHQMINDPVLAQKLRTLNLPTALHGCTLSQFEAWWETHGFKWFKDTITMGQSPLAAHQTVTPTKTIDNQPTSPSNYQPDVPRYDNNIGFKSAEKITMSSTQTDIFAEMLEALVNEVLHQKL